MNVGLEEQETVINYRREDIYAEIWTSDTTVMTKLDKRVKSSKDWELVKIEKFTDGSVASKIYRCPKKLVSFRGEIKSRVMTDEQKKLAAERLKKSRKKKEVVE